MIEAGALLFRSRFVCQDRAHRPGPDEARMSASFSSSLRLSDGPAEGSVQFFPGGEGRAALSVLRPRANARTPAECGP